MKQEQAITVFLILVFALALIYSSQDFSGREKAEVVEVVDGDTVKVIYKDNLETVRVLGIDTPEVHAENTPEEFYMKNTSEKRNCLRTVGEKASKYAGEILEDRKVKIVRDLESDKRGNYGRLLAYIEYNGTDLGKELLEKGHARVYNSSFSRIEKYRELEVEAREVSRGLWSDNCQ